MSICEQKPYIFQCILFCRDRLGFYAQTQLTSWDSVPPRPTHLEVAEERYGDGLAHQVHHLGDAPVLAVPHHAPVVARPHIVVPDVDLAEEGENGDQHHHQVYPDVGALAVGTLLHHSSQRVPDVGQAQGGGFLLKGRVPGNFAKQTFSKRF